MLDVSDIQKGPGRLKKWWNNLPERKKYLDLLAALLTIPVLLTVIVLNIISLRQNKKEESGSQPTIVITNVKEKEDEKKEMCKKEVGPISIVTPQENDRVTENPVCFMIKHDKRYCSVVWSYRVNGGRWSDFSTNAPCLYNMTPGNKKFELRVQSTESDDQEVFERNFVYDPEDQSVPTPTKEATSSAQVQ